MHVHLIAAAYPPMLGGISRSAQRCADLLRSIGHTVSITAPALSAAETLAASADTHREALPLFSDLSRMTELAERVCERLTRRPDVLLGYGLLPAGHVAVAVGARLGVPAVVSVRGNDLALFIYRFPDLVLKTLEQARERIFVASSLQRLACCMSPQLVARSTVILNSVELDRFVPAVKSRAPDGPLVVGTSGIVRWKKGFDLFVRACQGILAACPSVRFRVAGFPLATDADLVLRWVEQAGLTEHLSWSGPVEPAGMCHELHQMDLYLQCSYREGTPNALLEAMAVGLPVVAASADGVAETVRDGEDGYLVPLGDAEAMIRRSVALLHDPLQRQRLGRAACAAVHSRHHPQRERTQLEEVLQRAAGFAR